MIFRWSPTSHFQLPIVLVLADYFQTSQHQKLSSWTFDCIANWIWQHREWKKKVHFTIQEAGYLAIKEIKRTSVEFYKLYCRQKYTKFRINMKKLCFSNTKMWIKALTFQQNCIMAPAPFYWRSTHWVYYKHYEMACKCNSPSLFSCSKTALLSVNSIELYKNRPNSYGTQILQQNM